MRCFAFAVELRTEKGGAPENRTLDGFQVAAVFETVSSSMPDVLHVESPQWLGGVKGWELVVMLHGSTSGRFIDSQFTVGEPGQLPGKRGGDGG